MRQLSAAGLEAIEGLSRKHGFSPEAVLSMLDSVILGNSQMAQFNHPEFGGGQWMRGGMIMISDMFNNALKGRIDGLCTDLAALVASQPDLVQTGNFQSQSQGRSGDVSLFVAGGGNWWGAELGRAASTGAQNNVRYAWFPQSRRLAIEVNGQVTIYDTLEHQIGGFSQQQSHRSRTHNALPGRINQPGQSLVQNGLQRESRNRPVQTSQKSVGQKSIGHGIRMKHAPATRREQFHAPQRIVTDQLQGHQQPRQHRHRQECQGRNEIQSNQLFIHQFRVRFCISCVRGNRCAHVRLLAVF